ncbi:MAG: MEMAR_RS02690 family S-layer glycoprotein [Methanocorpusculum sp.]|nr:MEMAR_RS02690 family S-layer glycoprotein [Methanocorpusculum sp.]
MKKTQIMASLAIFLVAVLFIGAASAAATTVTVNVTDPNNPSEPSLLTGKDYILAIDTLSNYSVEGISPLPAGVSFVNGTSVVTTDINGEATFENAGIYKGSIAPQDIVYTIVLSGIEQNPTTGVVNFTGTDIFVDGADLPITYVYNKDNTTFNAQGVKILGTSLIPAALAVNVSSNENANVILNISSTDGTLALYNGTLSNGKITYTDNPVDLKSATYTFTITAKNVVPAQQVSVLVKAQTPVPTPTPAPGYDTRDVANGTDAFVFEHIKVVETDGAAVTGSKLTKFSDGSSPSVVNQISADSNGVFYLTEEVVNGQYGTYYVADKWTENAMGSVATVNIWYPELTIQAELTQNPSTGATAGDSIDGKNVNKDTEITFLINAPKVAPAYYVPSTKTGAVAKIVFTTPASGKTTAFGTGVYEVEFGAVTLNAAQTIAGWTEAGDDATAGTWTAQAEYKSPKAFADYAKKSNTISFTLQSSTLTLTAAKDSVVRSNPFTVTISGKAQFVYAIYLENAIATDNNPELQPSQSGFKGNFLFDNTIENNVAVQGGGFFETDASGKRTVQYNTAANTEDKTYTVKVNGLVSYDATTGVAILDTSDYDKVKVKVEKGAVTISASGDGSYYIGDEIKLTGTNTDSSNIFLFLTGQNLAENGIVLKDLPTKTAAHLAENPVAVKTDNTWEYKWDTSQIALDTGAYTIYATSRLTNGKSSDAIATESPYGTDGYAVKLSDSEYATVSVNLKQPFLSAVPSGTVIAQGDKLYVRGTAEGKPNNLMLYIFGPNFFEDYSITVEDDGTYEKKIDISSSMSSNQYFVVVQHPMYNGVFDAVLVKEQSGNYQYFKIQNTTTGGSQQGSFVVWGNNKLQGSQAADALTKMIDDANIDDIYTKLTFTVAAPWIRINNPGDQAMGSKFTITGTTNLAINDQILVEVMSSSFTAVDKTSTSTTSGVSQTTKVVKGDTDNTWSVDVDTTNWKLDEYTIKVNGIEVDVTTTTNFNLVEKVVTPTPTATATGATPTTTATATATATPQTPGFGAFIALAGLGAVALLVLRRD